MSNITLPEDLIVEILKKLPPKSLLRFTSVSKSWLHLIKNPRFISAYNTNLPLLLVLCFPHRPSRVNMTTRSSLHMDNEDLTSYEHPFFPFTLRYPSIVLGCHKGVVCIVHHGPRNSYKCILWNPSIGKYFKLPRPTVPFVVSYFSDWYDEAYGFWFDPRSEDFKVLRIVNTYSSNKPLRGCEVYSLKTGSWKIIPAGGTIVDASYNFNINFKGDSNFVNGCLHWIASFWNGHVQGYCRSSILVFNVTLEVFSEIELPNCLARYDSCVLFVREHNESTIMAFYDAGSMEVDEPFDIWVMKEYGVSGSWARMYSISSTGLHPSMPFMIGKTGDFLIELKDKSIVSVNRLEPQRNKYLVKSKSQFYDPFVHSYKQSLFLLDKGKDVYVYYKKGLDKKLANWGDNYKRFDELKLDEENNGSASKSNSSRKNARNESDKAIDETGLVPCSTKKSKRCQ